MKAKFEKVQGTGAELYELSKCTTLYNKLLGDGSYGELKFEEYYKDGLIMARDTWDSAVIFREEKTYTLYTKK